MDADGAVTDAKLQWLDYLVIGIVLSISAAIGIYYRYSGGRQRTAEEYFSANRSMGIAPLAIGLMASFMSGVSMLGVSSEIYIYGTQFMAFYLGFGIGVPIVSYLYLPVLYELQVMSVNEYLELRFGVTARLVASFAFFVHYMLYSGVVLYAPSLALESTTGLSTTASILLVGLVCMFYSTIGGIKAVLITDVFQAVLMYACLLSVIAVAASDLEGGLSDVWNIAYQGGRIDFSEFGLDPTIRNSWLGLLIGGCCVFTLSYGTNQVQVQRLMSTQNLQSSQKALLFNWPLILILSSITCYSGLALYAVYKDCDPIASGKIASGDRLMPLFAAERMIRIPGLAGLFISGIFSASLSTVSATLNSLAAVTLEDYIKPCYGKFGKQIPEERAALLGKILASLIGLASISLAFLFGTMDGLVQISLSITGAIGGPLLGLFTLGMFTESANEVGSVIGTVVSLVIGMWVVFGQPKPKSTTLPTTIIGCFANSTDHVQLNTTLDSFSSTNETSDFILYKISYIWYTPMCFIIAFLVGYLASIIYRLIFKDDSPDLDVRLFTPFLANRIKHRQKLKETNETQMYVFKTNDNPEPK